MKTNGHFLALLVALFFISAASASAGRKEIMTGGFTPIKNVSDPHIQEIGEFAVKEHNKEAKANLVFDKVVSGESQVVAGVNYRLVVSAKDGGAASKKYEAMVWEKAWMHFMNLTSFKPIP